MKSPNFLNISSFVVKVWKLLVVLSRISNPDLFYQTKGIFKSLVRTFSLQLATQAIGGLFVCKQLGGGTKSLVKIFGKEELDGTPEDTKGAKGKR